MNILLVTCVSLALLMFCLWWIKSGECITLRQENRRMRISLDTVKNQNTRMIAALAKMQAGRRRPK